MRTILSLILLTIAANPALASGGLNCSANEKDVSFDVSGGVTRGMGSPLFSFQGTVRIADPKVATDLAGTEFAQEHVAQYWLDGEDLRLRLYREREGGLPHGYVELGIETKAAPGDDGEGLYEGLFVLTVFDGVDDDNHEGVTVRREGQVSCFVE